jgi:hypothetical protein
VETCNLSQLLDDPVDHCIGYLIQHCLVLILRSKIVRVSADDILDAEEVYDDAPESGHAYADLAAAMGDEEDSDQEEEEEGEEQEGPELGSDADDDDLDLVSDEEDDLVLSDMDDADSADEGTDMDDPDHSDQQADDADDDELNPFELAEATDSDDEPKQKGALGFRVAAMQSSILSRYHMPWASTSIVPAASSAVALYSKAKRCVLLIWLWLWLRFAQQCLASSSLFCLLHPFS